MSEKHWKAISKSRYPWEQEALDFVHAGFPAQDNYIAWSNFEFIADDGSINEIDLLVACPQGIFLIEIKSSPGTVSGEPPDIILTTPESLEGMLISTNPQMKTHLRNLRAVVVDEIHAFAGDDRGWHLLCVLQRLAARTCGDLQRIGLSATVGNPEDLLEWLVAGSSHRRSVVQPPSQTEMIPEITLDYVGSLENAATVISRLHRGEKRLVFCDSRSRVERLASLLRSSGVQAFVSHSSLSATERRRSEEAFARGEDCVIVATSTLELGIDVGDLDRVIQIDAPPRVASFLQRLGRTGRRHGRARNCLFLCTNEDALLRGAALLNLWQQGYVEPIVPPPIPYHITAQQALALCLENGGMGCSDLRGQLCRLPPAQGTAEEVIGSILDHLVTVRFLSSDGTRYFIGEEGEKAFGRRNFLELVSVFASAPVLIVTDGRQELGVVDQNLFFSKEPAEGRLLSMAGCGWRVVRVDWKERRVFVTASEVPGKTNWFGSAAGLSLSMCRAIRIVLTTNIVPDHWSQRAKLQIDQLRAGAWFLRGDQTTVAKYPDGSLCWHTFGGEAINLALAEACASRGNDIEKTDDYGIRFRAGSAQRELEPVLQQMEARAVIKNLSSSDGAEELLKFSECVPPALLREVVVARRCTLAELAAVLVENRHYAVMSEPGENQTF